MGNDFDFQCEKKIKKNNNKEVLGQISIIDSENNILKNDDDLLLNTKYNQNNENLEEDFQTTLIKRLKDINLNLISLNKKNNEIKRNRNENIEQNNFYPFYDCIDEMKYEYIKKKNKIFKNTLKNEIKNTFIKPILVELENKKKEISEIKNLLENLNNNMLESKSNIEKEINSKIEIIKNGNENLSEQFKNQKINTEKMINKYDNNFIDLNKKIENINLNIKNVENENKKEIGDLQKKLSNDINKLKNDINSDINLKDQEFNSKLEGISKSAKENKSEIEEIKEEIKKLETEQIKLKNLDENKTKKLNELDKKIMSNKSKLDNAIKDIDLINKNSKKNMQSIVNESFKKFNNIFQKSFALNKYKLQKELKLKLFSDKNLAQVGLNNIGNNCYQNSVLQILKNIPKFVYNFYLMDKNSDKFLLSLKNLFIKTCFSNQNSF
jgi:hypothetical protein